MDPYPDQVDDLTHGGRPKLGPQQLEPLEGVRMEANPPPIEAGKHPPLVKVGKHPFLIEVGKHPPPTRAENWPPQAEVGSKLPQGARLTHPWNGKEWAMVDGGIGTKGPSGGLKEECLSPKALPTQLGLHRQDERPSAKFTTTWTV